jgi:hypothetical protein
MTSRKELSEGKGLLLALGVNLETKKSQEQTPFLVSRGMLIEEYKNRHLSMDSPTIRRASRMCG